MEPSDNQFREKRADNAAELLSREEDPSGVQRPRLNLSVGRITSPEGPDRTSLYRGLMDQAAPLYLADFGGNLVYTNKAFAGIARVLFGLSHDVAAGDETPPALMKIIEKIYLDMRPVQARTPSRSRARPEPTCPGTSPSVTRTASSWASAAYIPISAGRPGRSCAPAKWRVGCRT
jgi:hypothetical protein